MTVQTLAIIVLLVSFFVMIFLRFPIAYAVGLSSVLCMLVQGQALTDVCRLMVKGISSFSLMAVPFFITMGVLMGSGGISEKLIALADACVGWMRGGMAMVNIVASYFFGGISGSASADTASIGSIMIPMMVDQGYGADFSTAVTITSSCEGLLVPPSHNMVIYATTAGGISVGSLFLAGYLPGALLAIVLMIGSYIISVKRNYPKGDPFSIKAFVKQLGTSIWALAAVIIVVFGVVGGVFTATESADRVNNPRLPGHPDIVLRKYHTCIFVNGCFWHGHEGCKYFRMPKTNTEFWERKISRNRERDREEQKQLARMGWHCITVWECELKGERREKTLESLEYKMQDRKSVV